MITSPDNEKLKLIRRLRERKHREREGLFAAEGEDIVEEGLAAGLLPEESFVAAERAPDDQLINRLGRGGRPVHLVADAVLAALGSLGHPARVIAVFRRDLLPQRVPEHDLGVFLHRVIDPGNVGTVVRAAGALGPAFVALSPGCSDPFSGKGVRASMGAVFRVPIESGEAPPQHMRQIGLVASGGDPVWEIDLAEPVVFLVGAERHGLPPELVAGCQQLATIPQASGADSLNAAAAATIALYETARQRARPSPGSPA